MSFLFDTPEPPNPIYTAAAQTGSNVSTAIANQKLGQINQVTPQGNLTYTDTGSYNFTDPTTGGVYGIPTSTATQTLNPTAQSSFNLQQLAQEQLAGLSYEQAARMRQQFNSTFNLDNAPAYGDINAITGAPQAQGMSADTVNGWGVQGGFADAGQIGSTFGAAPDVTRTYQHGEDFSADRQRIEAGLMERLNPSLAIERNKYQQQLADQGIRPGSPAYDNMMRNYSMQANDARLGVIGQGGQEQQRLSEMSRLAGEFGNKAQQQIYEQAKGRGEFGNLAQQQAYEQAFGRGQFQNAAQQQWFAQDAAKTTSQNAALAQNFQQATAGFNAQNALRQQYGDEAFALRNQPINEISALLSGSQVAQPNFLSTNSATIPTTDTAGILNTNFNQQMAVSNQQAALANTVIGGMFGFGGGLARGGAFNTK